MDSLDKQWKQATENFQNSFEMIESSIPKVLRPQSEKALEKLVSLKPTEVGKKDNWHFPNLTMFSGHPFSSPDLSNDKLEDYENILSHELAILGLGNNDVDHLAFINGRYFPGGSDVDDDQVKVISLASQRDLTDVERILPTVRATNVHGKNYSSTKGEFLHPFLLLNTAFMTDGVMIDLKHTPKQMKPLCIVNVSQPDKDSSLTSSHVLIRLAPHTSLTVFEVFILLGAKDTDDSLMQFSNAVTDVVLEEDASMHHVKLLRSDSVSKSQSDFLHHSMFISCQENAKFCCEYLQMGSVIARHEVRSDLVGAGSELKTKSLSVAAHHGSYHNHCYVEHDGERSRSTQTHRAIATDEACVNWRSHVLIRDGGTKSITDQHADSLLLSPSAQAHAAPRLEIRTPDVKSTHGSTTGHLDRDQLFYLMARGLSYAAASTLITMAFAKSALPNVASVPSVNASLCKLVEDMVRNMVARSKAFLDIPGVKRKLDIDHIRSQFPILRKHRAHGQTLVYLDSGATTQKPSCVISKMRKYYEEENANPHRGVYDLSEIATLNYENGRKKVAQFIGAQDPREIVFTRGTTEGINLVASTLGRDIIKSGDEIIVTEMEHHSNIVPWQILCSQTGAKLKVVPVTPSGELDINAYENLLSEHTKLVCFVHISNVLGTINPVKEMVALAKAKSNAYVLVDGAQGGGDMIKSVSFTQTIYSDVPQRFEAGTQNMAGVAGMCAAVDFLEDVGMNIIGEHENEIMEYALKQLKSKVPGLTVYGDSKNRIGNIAFTLQDIHPHDIGSLADQWGVAIRTGHHCCEPLHHALNVESSARASFSIHTTKTEIDMLVATLRSQLGLVQDKPVLILPPLPVGETDSEEPPKKKVAEAHGDSPPSHELNLLYRDVVLDHNRHPHNRRVLESCDHESNGYNPLCGDRVTVYVKVQDDVITDVSFTGSGCAVSQACASMMTVRLKGCRVDETEPLFNKFLHILSFQDATDVGENEEPDLGKLSVFAGLGRFPARVKCATLPWHTFFSALEGEDPQKGEDAQVVVLSDE